MGDNLEFRAHGRLALAAYLGHEMDFLKIGQI